MKKKYLYENERIEDGKFFSSQSIQASPKVNKDVAKTIITNLDSFQESNGDGVKVCLTPTIEAIHAITTGNFTVYREEKLKGDYKKKSGTFSFLHPYKKPVITNHNLSNDPIGRVVDAKFLKECSNGKPGVVISADVTDPEAIKKIIDERYLTVSVGSHTDSVICNICGTDLVEEGFCGHFRGEKYGEEGNKVVAKWILGDIYFDEISFVNRPADEDAGVLNTGEEAYKALLAKVGEESYSIPTFGSTTMESDSTLNYEGSNIYSSESSGDGFMPNQNIIQDTSSEIGTPENSMQLVEYLQKLQYKEKTIEPSTEDDPQVEEENTEGGKKNMEGEKKPKNNSPEVNNEETKETLAKTIEELTEKNEALSENVTAIEEEKKKLEESNEALTIKVSELEEEVEALDEQNQDFMEKIVSEKSQHKEDLASVIATLKEFMNQLSSDERQTYMQELSERSFSSLNDTISDLLSEVDKVIVSNEEVINETLHNNKEGKHENEIVEGEDGEEQQEEFTEKDKLKMINETAKKLAKVISHK